MVSYTITASDVSSVNPASALTAGVVFNWSSETITFPNTVDFVDAQSLVDHCRFAEASSPGMSQPRIMNAAGKVQIGTDPATGNPIQTGVVAILENGTTDDGWKVVTGKGSGNFVVRDVYRDDGSLPYSNASGVFIQYLTTIGGVIANTTTGSGLSTQQATQLSDVAATLVSPGIFSSDALANAPSSSGSGATAQQIWEYATRTLTALPETAALEASVQDALDAIAALNDGDATATNQSAILSAIAQLQSITAELHTFRGLNAAKPIFRDKTGNATTETDGTVTLTHTANLSNETVSTQRSG